MQGPYRIGSYLALPRRSWKAWFQARVIARREAERNARRNDWAAQRQALCPNDYNPMCVQGVSSFRTWGEGINDRLNRSGL
jgi:hypothetical protein